MKQTPAVSNAYSAENERGFRRTIQEEFRQVVRRDRDYEPNPDARIILTSPNGTRYALTVSNAGALSTVAV